MRHRSSAQVETGLRKDCSFQDRCSCILRLLTMQVDSSSQVGKQRSVRRSDLSMDGTVERLRTPKLEHHASWPSANWMPNARTKAWRFGESFDWATFSILTVAGSPHQRSTGTSSIPDHLFHL